MSDCFDQLSHFPLAHRRCCFQRSQCVGSTVPDAFWPTDRPTAHTRIWSIIWTSRCCVQVCSLANEQAGCEPRLRGYVGDFIMTAENSTTAHSRATLAGHRPMPCYGEVNASVITDQAAPVGQAQGIRTLPRSMCTHASGTQTTKNRPTIARTGLSLAYGQAFSRAKLLFSYSDRIPSRSCMPVPSDSLSRAKRYHAASTLVDKRANRRPSLVRPAS